MALVAERPRGRHDAEPVLVPLVAHLHAAESVPELETPEQLFADKYAGGRMHHDGRHAWLKVTPSKIVSWDFRKIGA